MMTDIQKLREILHADGVLFSFSGTISQDVLTSIAETVEHKMISHNISTKTIQKVFAVLVEMMQNIMSYSQDHSVLGNGTFQSPGIAVVGIDPGNGLYYVASGNLMDTARQDSLAAYLDRINALDEAGQKDLYRELRKSGQNKHERGAGLGLLEMRRKAARPLEYSFRPLGRDGTFFSLKVFVEQGKHG